LIKVLNKILRVQVQIQ